MNEGSRYKRQGKFAFASVDGLYMALVFARVIFSLWRNIASDIAERQLYSPYLCFVAIAFDFM